MQKLGIYFKIRIIKFHRKKRQKKLYENFENRTISLFELLTTFKMVKKDDF